MKQDAAFTAPASERIDASAQSINAAVKEREALSTSAFSSYLLGIKEFERRCRRVREVLAALCRGSSKRKCLGSWSSAAAVRCSVGNKGIYQSSRDYTTSDRGVVGMSLCRVLTAVRARN